MPPLKRHYLPFFIIPLIILLFGIIADIEYLGINGKNYSIFGRT